MRELSSQDILKELLETFTEARDALAVDVDIDQNIASSMDSKALTMSELWNQGSYAQLEQGLKVLRVEDGLVYWHVRERFLKGGTRRIIGCRECGRPAPGFCPGCGKQSPWVDDRGIVCSGCRVAAPRCPVSHQDGAARVKVPVGWVSVPAAHSASESAVGRGVVWLDAWFKTQRLVPMLPRALFCRVSGCAGCGGCERRAA